MKLNSWLFPHQAFRAVLDALPVFAGAKMKQQPS
jgi:hypothetical protein